ncbi:MAG: hypothetical protein IJY32_05245, partial [Mogibacterium sp.]|nr:hypothetical protein [Mogibacterium sp.]
SFRREFKMRTEGSLESRINNLCSIAGYTEDEMQKLGTKLLRIFRDVCRNNKLDADDIIEDLCSDSFESDEYKRMNESLVRLEFFASESTRSRYESEINKTMKTAWMLKVMETLKMNVYSFDGYGPEFVSILTLCYMTSFKYTEQEILAELNISRQNFYKKKKYATILFALEFEEFKQDISVRCNPVMKSSRQMTIDDFMDQSRDFSETFQRQSEVRSGIY